MSRWLDRGLIALAATVLAGCATSPGRGVDPLSVAPGALSSSLAGLRARTTLRAADQAVLARLEEATGAEAAAAGHWLDVAERAPALRAWAVLRLIDLSERVPIDRSWLARARALPDLADLAEALALKLADREALAEARGRLGTAWSWRRSARLLRYPGSTTSPPLADGRFQPPLQGRAGFIASPEEGPGLYAFDLALPAGRHLVEVTSECSVRAFVGAARVLDHDALEALLPERVTFPIDLGPGESLQLHLVSRTAVARARVLVRAPEASVITPTGRLAALASFELALAAADISAAQRAAAALPPDSPFGALAAARLAVADPSRAPERARSAAKTLLAAALVREPSFVEARALLVRLHAEDQELDDATRVLATFDGDGPLGPAAVLAFTQSDATRAATLAGHIHRGLPRSCRARGDWLDTSWERLRLHPDEVVAAFDEPSPPLPGPCLEARLRAIELLREAFHLAQADALLAPLTAPTTDGGLDPGPERARAEVLLAQVALARGQWAEVAEHARKALTLGGVDAFAKELVARAERLQGGPAMPRLDPASDLGLPLADTRALIRAHLRKGAPPVEDGREVLLDDRFVRVYPDGSMRVRVHRVVRVNDVAAVEAVGELPIPDDAEVLVVRTWKNKAGALRSLEPEDILEKATVSLPALSPGDFAEWAWFYPLAASPRLTPGWRAPAHAFDSDDGPVVRARYTLSLASGARPPVFVVDPRVPPPVHPDETTWVFSAARLPRVFGEPMDPLPELRRMTLRVSSGIERLPYADALAAEIAFGTRGSPTLAATLADATRRLPHDAAPDAIVLALYDAVRGTIDEPPEASPFAVEASWVAERRRGSRALLLTALCRAAGLGCELVLARPLWEGPEPAYADPEALSYPLVRWAPVGRPPLWLDPTSRWLPFGLLPPALEGVFAISLGAPGLKRPMLTETPSSLADPTQWGERKVDMKLALAPDGASVVASGAEVLDGVFASSWRAALVALTPDARERILGAIVQQALPGATIESVALEHLEDDAYPLAWSWRARTVTRPAGGNALTERGQRSIAVALFPEGLTHDTVLLPVRTTPLLVNRAARMVLTLTFMAPEGWAFVTAPSDQQLVYDLGHFERNSRFEDLGRTVVIDKRFLLRPGVIEPSRYAAWSDAAVAIDRFDLVQAVAAPTQRTPSFRPQPRTQSPP